MEPLSVAAAATLAMKYIMPAVRDLGSKVLDSSEESVSTAIVGFGKRLLSSLLSRGPQVEDEESDVLRKGLERRVRALVDDPVQQRTAIQLEGAIEDLLLEDAALLARISGMLTEVPKEIAGYDMHSTHIGRDNSGLVITGDGNSVTQRPQV